MDERNQYIADLRRKVKEQTKQTNDLQNEVRALKDAALNKSEGSNN